MKTIFLPLAGLVRHLPISSKATTRLLPLLTAVGLSLVPLSPARAQTTILSEGFENAFPAFNGWSVGDVPVPGVYWNDVNSTFGTVSPHSGSWKGYCAGVGYGGTAANPTYANYMTNFMSRSINLAGYSAANLSFWVNIPSIETNYDRLRVYVDTTQIWSASTSTLGWALVTLPLNAYVGGTHTLKFQFDSDYSNVYEGAYLDDILADAANQPILASMQSLQDANYTGYVLDCDTTFGRSNIQAQAVFKVENFTGVSSSYSNVLSFRLLNSATGLPHPIYNLSNTATNVGYTYTITNAFSLAPGTNITVTSTANIRPAVLLSQFSQYYLECRMLTNGVLAQTLTTTPSTYYHFTNTVSGDTAYNVLLNFTNAGWSRTYAVQTIPGQNTFQVDADYEVRRWDGWLGLTATASIPVVFNYTLRNSAGTIISLASSSQTFYDSVTNYVPVVMGLWPFTYTENFPSYMTASHTLDIQPAGQLDSVTKTYYLTVSLSHTNNPVTGQVIAANSQGTTTNELMHFDGKLYFGSIPTTLTGLGLPIPPVNLPVGAVIPTTLNGASGYVTSKSDHTYAGAGALSVNLNAAGDAFVTAGSVTLIAPSPDTDSTAKVGFQRGAVTLSSAGASSTVTATLPGGFGYRLSDTSSQVLTPYVPFGSTSLNGSLVPSSDLIYLPGSPIYAAEESKPAWFVTDRIIWHISTGKFDLPSAGVQGIFVSDANYTTLQSVSNLLVDPPAMGDKRSNDKYWLALSGVSTSPTALPDSSSNALVTTEFSFGPGIFRTHFPYDVTVKWADVGKMRVQDDLITPSSSYLGGASKVGVSFTRDCPDCGGGGAGMATPAITITNNQFAFTRDGGLVALGIMGSFNLQWGYITNAHDYAQTAKAFTDAAFHMPGNFIRGDQNSLADEQGPTTILYSGFLASNVGVIERPLSAGYSAGLADYGGLNFRAVADNIHGAVSTIAGLTGIPWRLDYRSKYYVRYSGVTGIHEAVPGTFPTNLTLWGYAFTFTSYGLSYRDSQNRQSVTDGSINLPAPAGFIQGFDNMTFSCLGAPLGSDLPQGDGYKLMTYWLADFKTLSLQFKTDNQCDPTANGYLVLGVKAHASHVLDPLYGEVGFFSNGDQIPPSFNLSGVTSRLKVPNSFTMDGPSKTSYTFTPVEDAYFNTWSNSPPATAGWINMYGKLDVPFFEDLQVHLQTSCHTNGVAASNAPICLSGGWPRAGTTTGNHGWLDPYNRTPFETNLFDFKNLGWPGSAVTDIGSYRDNQGDQEYHPRAQRVWLGFVKFDYPLSWSSSLRTFKSWQEVQEDLLIVNVQHQVKYMDPKHAELDFGAQYDGLPTISIANMAFNAIDEATGVGAAIAKAAAQPVEDVLSSGLDKMNQLLDSQMQQLMDGVFAKTVDPVIDQFYTQLSNEWNGLTISQKLRFVQNVQTNTLNFFVGTGPHPATHTLLTALQNLGDGVDSANSLIGQVRGYVDEATNAIQAVIGTITNNVNGQPIGSNVVGLISKVGGDRPVVPKLVQSLVGEIAPQFIDAIVGPTVSNLLQEIEPALTEVADALKQTQDALLQVDAALAQTGEFTQEIQNTLNTFSSQLANVSVQVSLSVTQYFGQFDYNVDNPFQSVSAADLKHFIRQKVEDQFFGTEAASGIQTALRQRLYDLDAAMKQGIDSGFQQINGMMRDLISQALAEVDDSINQCLGQVSEVMGAGKLNGHANIVGDSLKLLRIDGHFQFKVPNDMELDAFLEIKELTSDGSSGCYSTNAPATEVTIGASGIPLSFAGTDAKANVMAKFTFDSTAPYPVNLGGQVELVGELNFEAFQLHDLAAAMAFGKYENYIALKGGVKFSGYDFSGAVFFGRTCSLDPLMLIDPDVAKVLGDPPFTGAYCYAQGWIPISETLLGIPASCLFEISAGVGAGAFYFAEGPTFGGKMFLGVSGSLLCIVSIEGEISLIGVKHGDDMRFNGHGHFEADIGPCPFCISVGKDVDITYINKSWNIE